MDILISLLTAFGLGSIVTAFIQSWLSKKAKTDERRFREKQIAYMGLLEAYHQAALAKMDDAAKQFAHWQMRCALVAPKEVRDCIQQLLETERNTMARTNAQTAMEAAMRKDLGITK